MNLNQPPDHREGTTERQVCFPRVIKCTERDLVMEGQGSVKQGSSLLGMGLSVLSGLLFATMTLFAKFANGVPAFEVVFLRSLVAVLLFLPAVLFYVDGSVFGPREQLGWLCGRAVTGVVGMALSVYAVKRMPIGDASVVIFITPILTGIISRLTLKEPWGWCQALASFVSVIGVVFIAQPPFLFDHFRSTHTHSETHLTQAWQANLTQNSGFLSAVNRVANPIDNHSSGRTFAVLVGFLSAFVMACAYVLGRKVGQKVHFLIIGFAF